jgi:DNA-binding CsgD family transcriptional regulator
VHNVRAAAVSFVHGRLRVARLARELLCGARESVSRVGGLPVMPAAEFDPAQRELLRLGVRLRTLHERASLATRDQLERAKATIALGEQARIAAGEPLRMLLVDGEAVMLPLATGDDAVRIAMVARGGPLLVALEDIFEELWRTGAAVDTLVDNTLVDDALAGRPTAEDCSILSLLAAGATDDGIGRRLGVSARTAHRRVRELMARLGVQTRFQAGAQAVRSGWL